MTWSPGKDRIADLLGEGELERVAPDDAVVQDAVAAQFAPTVRAFKAFGRIRRARNRFEYPDTDSPGPTIDDVNDAIATATQAADAATTILAEDLLTLW